MVLALVSRKDIEDLSQGTAARGKLVLEGAVVFLLEDYVGEGGLDEILHGIQVWFGP